MVEIAKALSYESELLIMDEPTSALTERDAEHLFTIIRELQAQGKGILYITHKMGRAVRDRGRGFRVPRRQIHWNGESSQPDRDEIIRMMVGRELARIFPREPASPGAVVLSARKLTLEQQFHDITFDLHAGEILGIAGLIGSGRSKLAEPCSASLRRAPADSDRGLRGEGRFAAGGDGARMALVTEDRKEDRLLPRAQCAREPGDLGAQPRLRPLRVRPPARRYAGLRGDEPLAARQNARSARAHRESLRRQQQKVLLGRWLLTGRRFSFSMSRRAGSTSAPRPRSTSSLRVWSPKAPPFLMISSEMPEILGMSHESW